MKRFPYTALRRVSMRSAFMLLMLLGMCGCLVRHREKLAVATAAPPPPLKTASLQDLINKLKAEQGAIETLNATGTIEPTVTSLTKGETVHYRDIRTFILLRQPASIRMIGLYPVVENKAFDMTSDGNSFQLFIPAKNRFVVGTNHEETHAKPGIENIRPQHILDALLVKGPEPGKEEAVLEVYADGPTSFYIVHVLRLVPGKWPQLARNIWFERRDLEVVRLQVFDDQAEEVTNVLYSDFRHVAGIPYPREILVDRPKDLYGIRLVITDLKLNEPIADDKFHLEQPPGTQLVNIDQQNSKKDNNVG